MFGSIGSRQYLMLSLTLLYVGINLTSWFASDPVEMGDTYRYFGFAIFDPQNPGISTSLLYQILENTHAITFFQVCLATVSTLMLGWAVAQSTHFRLVGIALVALILVISLTSPLWSWQTLLATEGLSLSLATLWLAAIVFMLNPSNNTTFQVPALVLTGSVLVITKPQFVVIVVPVTVLLAIASSRRGWPGTSWILMVIGFLPAATFAIWRIMQLALDQSYGYLYVTNNYLDKVSTFRVYADANMPVCGPLTTAISGPSPWTDVTAMRDSLISLCPETYLWLKSGPTGVWNWSLAMPFESLSSAISTISKLTIEPYSPMMALPSQISQTLFPQVPSVIWMAGAWVIGIGLALSLGIRWKLSAFSIFSVFVVVISFAILMYGTWASDGIEHARHQAPWVLFSVLAGLVIPTATGKIHTVSRLNES